MSKVSLSVVLLWLSIASLATAQKPADRVDLGRLTNGANIAFFRSSAGEWGLEIAGGDAPRFAQPQPAQIEVFTGGENARDLASGYQSVKKEADGVVATAKVAGQGQAAFAVEDRWTISGAVLSLVREVSVAQAEENAGFYSAIDLVTVPEVQWTDATYFVPGLLYGNASYAGGRAHECRQLPCQAVFNTRRLSIGPTVRNGFGKWELGGGAGSGAARRYDPGREFGAGDDTDH